MTIKFCDLELETGDGVLKPRAETELLARTALGLLRELDGTRVIDMCTGAGNLACAIAHAEPRARVWASDLTDACVTLARKNVARLQLSARVEVVRGDLFAPLDPLGLERSIDLIVCNPPYISTGRLAKESAHLLAGEPREAFDGGPYGLTIHQRVIREAPRFLRAGGWLAFEIGLGQDRQVDKLFARVGSFELVRSAADENGAPRVIAARLGS